MNIRVVVAEDHPILRTSMVRALGADPGIEIVGQAGNGRTALELARTLRPDVIVLDLGMPEVGGAVVLGCAASCPTSAGHLLREVRGSARGEASSVRPAIAPRELEVLRLVAKGLTDREIARELYMSPSTVQKHLTRIRQKTGLRRRSELARWAVEHAVV